MKVLAGPLPTAGFVRIFLLIIAELVKPPNEADVRASS